MKEKQIELTALNIDPAIFFLGSEAEQEEAERKEEERENELKKLIFAPDFRALAYTTGGLYKVFTRSTHPGAFWALSVFYQERALSHSTYTEAGQNQSERHKTIFSEIKNETLQNPLTLDILTD